MYRALRVKGLVATATFDKPLTEKLEAKYKGDVEGIIKAGQITPTVSVSFAGGDNMEIKATGDVWVLGELGKFDSGMGFQSAKDPGTKAFKLLAFARQRVRAELLKSLQDLCGKTRYHKNLSLTHRLGAGTILPAIRPNPSWLRPAFCFFRIPVIVASDIAMQYGAKRLFSDVTAKFLGGSRDDLIGANGCGKSTFMKSWAGEMEPGAGTVAIGFNERVGRLGG